MTENRIHKMLIAASMAMVFGVGPSLADATPAEQAAQMLARAQTVDMKCSYLNAADKDALSNLVARAELALATRESVAATKATLQRGHAAGMAASCNANEKQSAVSILAAARQASVRQGTKSTSAMASTAPPVAVDMAPAPPLAANTTAPILKARPSIQTKVAEPQPVKKILPQVKVVQPQLHVGKPALVAQTSHVKKPTQAAAASGSLQHYAKISAAYYLALRCSGGGANVNGLYASIVAAHGNVMQTHGAGEVSVVLRRAKARSASQNCS